MSKKILWFSCGATSAVACKLAITEYGADNVIIFYFKIESAHPDNERFIQDCEKWYGLKINIRSSKFKDQFDVIAKTKYVNGPQGARCTKELKRDMRLKIEKEIDFDGQIFGFEFEKKEIERSLRLPSYTQAKFPSIEKGYTKANCLGMLEAANIELPTMYKLGYPNNNCVGCVKGGMGYWNKIRIDFPIEFDKMKELEKDIGRSCLKEPNGDRLFLENLHPDRGRKQKIIIPDCGFFCEEI